MDGHEALQGINLTLAWIADSVEKRSGRGKFSQAKRGRKAQVGPKSDFGDTTGKTVAYLRNMLSIEEKQGLHRPLRIIGTMPRLLPTLPERGQADVFDLMPKVGVRSCKNASLVPHFT